MAKFKFKPNKQKYVLELDEYEAKVLQALVGHILGDFRHSHRGVTDKIYYALDGVLDLDYDECKTLAPNKTIVYENSEKATKYLMENK